jgi:hypothetical protein
VGLAAYRAPSAESSRGQDDSLVLSFSAENEGITSLARAQSMLPKAARP